MDPATGQQGTQLSLTHGVLHVANGCRAGQLADLVVHAAVHLQSKQQHTTSAEHSRQVALQSLQSTCMCIHYIDGASAGTAAHLFKKQPGRYQQLAQLTIAQATVISSRSRL
jgi:hypothetical protein